MATARPQITAATHHLEGSLFGLHLGHLKAGQQRQAIPQL